jgi:hypothetical protein
MTGSRPFCKGCRKFADDLTEYQEMADVFDMTPDAYIEAHEETFDPRLHNFFCTPCWVRAGMPIRTAEGVRLLAGKPVYRS